MERIDLEMIVRVSRENMELRRLWDEHQELERRLEDLLRKGHLTISEEVDQREMKKRKLSGRDRIEQILATYR